MKKTIFISSPYTSGNVEANVLHQIIAMHDLMDKGYAPFTPLLSHYANEVQPRPYGEWLEFCLEWVSRCDALVRLKSDLPSSGSDREEAEAKRLGKPFFLGVGSVPHADQLVLGPGVIYGCL